MDDMCQKSINTLWIITDDQSQYSLAHVANVTKSQPNIT
jgi:hypothetical protein